MKIHWFLLAAGLLAAGNVSSATIQYEVSGIGTTPTGESIFNYRYFVTDITLSENQEIEIRYDPELFASLMNPSAGVGLDVLVFQPDNPPGTFGVFSIFALTDNPALDVPFQVDVVYLGLGLPGAQPFVINQYGPNGIEVIGEGFTVPDGGGQIVPEPGTLLSTAVILGIVGFSSIVRRRRRRSA